MLFGLTNVDLFNILICIIGETMEPVKPNITVRGILSYPSLLKAVSLANYPDNPPKFRCSVLLQKGSVDLQRLEQRINEIKQEKWKDKIPSDFEIKCLTDLSHDAATQNYVSLKALNDASSKPRVIDAAGEEVLLEELCVPGLECKMSVSIYAYSKSGNGISAGINGVKLLNTMGELGRLGRAQMSDDEMFDDDQSFTPVATEEQGQKVLSSAHFEEQFTMTEKAIEVGWLKRSDVLPTWNDEQLIEHGYMIVETPPYSF